MCIKTIKLIINQNILCVFVLERLFEVRTKIQKIKGKKKLATWDPKVITWKY